MKIKHIIVVLFLIAGFLSILVSTKTGSDIYSSNLFIAVLFGGSVLLTGMFTSNNMRGTIFTSAISSVLAVNLYVMNNFQLKFGSDFILATLLTCFGAAFLVLWFDNTKIKQFLITGVVFLWFGLLFATVLNATFVSDWLTFIAATVANTWPYLLIIIGTGSLARARMLKKSISPPPEQQF